MDQLDNANISKMDKKRERGLDILRSLAMLMIVVLHFLGKGGRLSQWTDQTMNSTQIAAWVLEAFCIVAVNVYMLISGYFYSNKGIRWQKLIELWLEVWFYSVVVGVVCARLGLVANTTVDAYYYYRLIFPISMEHYWFMTAYVILLMFLPFLGNKLDTISRENFRTALIILFTFFCLIKSLLPIKLDTDKMGYDCLWYMCVFLFAAYIRRFEIKLFKNKFLGLVLYVLGVSLILAESFLIRGIYLKTGALSYILGISFEYNHIFCFVAALGLFIFFKNIKADNFLGFIFSKIAPYTLGVYLLHENLGLRYTWQSWFGVEKIDNVIKLIIGVLISAMVMFMAGIIVDFVRQKGFNLVKKLLVKACQIKNKEKTY